MSANPPLMGKFVDLSLTNGGSIQGKITGAMVGGSSELIGWWIDDRLLVFIAGLARLEVLS